MTRPSFNLRVEANRYDEAQIVLRGSTGTVTDVQVDLRGIGDGGEQDTRAARRECGSGTGRHGLAPEKAARPRRIRVYVTSSSSRATKAVNPAES